MNLADIHKIYFIGIGGIGMSALARYFKRQGIEIHGYDRTETELTRALAQEGMFVHYEDNVRFIPENVDLVVFTPAVPADHTELLWFRERNYPIKKRAEVLGIISRSRSTVAIAGTHGKTTTSSMTAHLLRACGIDANAFVGGIALNLGGNYAEGSSEWVVVEADEYDRSFLHLHPDVAVVNSVDADHLDIYGTEAAVQESYAQFAKQVTNGGQLFVRHGIELGVPAQTFGIDNGYWQARSVRVEQGFMVFDLYEGENRRFEALRLPYPGLHNVANATAAIACALRAGADASKIPDALTAFRGVKRRFEYILKNADCVFIDDYAHHPAELDATIRAAKALFPDKKISGAFQPHLYSRTRDFAQGFAEALDLLDECLLLDIYPARELPIEGVSSATIAGLMQRKPTLCSKAELPDLLQQRRPEVLLTMGAGDIDTLLQTIKSKLQ